MPESQEPPRIRLSGSPQELKTQISSVMAIWQLLESKDIGNIWAVPTDEIIESQRTHPQIILLFKQDKELITNKKIRRLEGRIAFRLMNESPTSLSKGEAINLAKRIKAIFAGEKPYIWEKGRELYTYKDRENGYLFQILAKKKTDAKQLITAVLTIQSHAPKWANLNLIKNQDEPRAYPQAQKQARILGDTVNLPVQRRTGKVRFYKAELFIPGQTHNITLYDREGRSFNPLIT